MMNPPGTPPPAQSAHFVVTEDLGNIPVVSVDFFINHVLPSVNSTVLKNIKAALVTKKHINRKKWSAFPKSPKATGKRETQAFSKLETLIGHIVEAASPFMNSKTALKFVHNPNVAPASERNNDSHPDGYLELKMKNSLGARSSSRHSQLCSKGAPDKSRWEDIVLPFEFKLNEKDYEDNISKLVWSAHYIMRTDPCRRFTFGITTEDTKMRLWFFARSHVMMTHPFNFIVDHDIVIHIFTSLMFADLESLGFDSTVSRIVVDNQIQYRFQVGDEFYITAETLADHAADFIRGRGTRVFKAHCESDPSHSVVLKDVWLEDDRTQEGFLLESIRAAVAEMQTQGTVFPGNKDPSTYFLTVKAHGLVKVNGQTEDHTTRVMMRGSGLPSDLEYFPTTKRRESLLRGSCVIGSDRGYSVGHTPQVSSDVAALVLANVPRKAPRFQARIHYRIVFNEVGRSIHELCRLSDVYQCLADATIALEILHILGYVHRDVSAGNILFWKSAGILSDLESAKKTTDLTTHEVRTGTNEYESIEVSHRRYLFRDYKDSSSPPAFKFNCIHDLESAWWIALWVLFHHVPLDNKEDRSSQILRAAELFPSVSTSLQRSGAFLAGNVQDFEALAPTFQHSAEKLLEARKLLVKRYHAAETGPSIDETAFTGIHKTLLDIWQKARDESQHIEYRFVLLAKREMAEEPTSAGPSKRLRTRKR